MRLRDVSGIEEILKGSSLAGDPLWERDLAHLSEIHITLFYARAGLKGLRSDAVALIERAQTAAALAAFKGNRLPGISVMIRHHPPDDPFLIDDLVLGLAKLNKPRRCACLYALVMHTDLPTAAGLTWQMVPQPQQRSNMPALAREVLDYASRTRHIRLPYVFWEWATPKIAAPLMELTHSVEVAFECTWPQLVEKHGRVVQINRSADAASFLDLAEEVRTGRL